jgi:glycerophosphoryl diester phosphodiesterase
MKIIGHRGARGLAPENTIAALHKGIEHQADMVEFDIRVTKDHIPVLQHDEDLTDPNGQQRRIADYTYAELHDHKKDLATLDEVLSQISHSVRLYIEVKAGEPIEPIVKVLQRHMSKGWKPTDFILASFGAQTLRDLHAALPEVETMVLEKWSGARASYRGRQLGTRNLCMNQQWLWKPFIQPMAKRGWNLYAYTLNDPAKAKRWGGYGLAGIVTDYPDRFQK